MGLLWEKKKEKFGEQAPYVIFGQFGRQKTKLHLKMMCCPSKDLRVLLFIFFDQRRNCFVKNGPLTLVGFID